MPPPVPCLSVTTSIDASTSVAETPERYAEGPLPAVSVITPAAPSTDVHDGLLTDHAPPTSAVPKPLPTVRVKLSAASCIGAAMVTWVVWVAVAPWLSVTVRVIVYVPGA